ncbi:MAG: histidinol-phosphatase, partial [Planctomycetes bacterium]|nr:histidinol-phosphatase [Planctomycetota bacterium]
TVRVDEAVREGLDFIAITDHIEYQPHRKDVPTNHNRPFELAAGKAKDKNILLPLATEITHDTPPGHANAIFLKDVNLLDVPDYVQQIKLANDQGGFVFWNHHEWKGEEKGGWFAEHNTIYKNGWLHGMEVSNGRKYYPRAHQWCLDKNLTMVGTSDMHAPSLIKQTTPDEHRTQTLVFAKERTLESVREALFAGRTLVWLRDELIGTQKNLELMFAASVKVFVTNQIDDDTQRVVIINNAGVDIELERTGEAGPKELTLPANAMTTVMITIDPESEQKELLYTAVNFVMAPEKGLPVTLKIASLEPVIDLLEIK